MTSNHSNINMKTKEYSKQNDKIHLISSKFVLEYSYEMLNIQVQRQLSKKIQASLVIFNVVSNAVRVNEIHSSYRNWQLEYAHIQIISIQTKCMWKQKQYNKQNDKNAFNKKNLSKSKTIIVQTVKDTFIGQVMTGT